MAARVMTLVVAVGLGGCVGNQCSRSEPTTAREARSREEAKREEDAAIAQNLYEAAKRQMHRTEFHAAWENLERARRLDPGSKEIRDLHNEVSRILNRRPAEWNDGARGRADSPVVRNDQTRIEVENHFHSGEEQMKEGKLAEAVREFEAVIMKLRWVPYDSEMNDLLERARELRSECLRLLDGGR